MTPVKCPDGEIVNEGFLHYHRHTVEDARECSVCNDQFTTGWLRCQDARPLCDPCYFEHGQEEERKKIAVW